MKRGMASKIHQKHVNVTNSQSMMDPTMIENLQSEPVNIKANIQHGKRNEYVATKSFDNKQAMTEADQRMQQERMAGGFSP